MIFILGVCAGRTFAVASVREAVRAAVPRKVIGSPRRRICLSPSSARARAAALLAAAAVRRLPGLPRIVLPDVLARDRVGAGGGPGAAQGLHGAVREPGVLELDDDPA